MSITSQNSLPIVAFEHFMLADDRPDYPMVFFVRLTLDGLLKREAFESAVRRTLPYHRLLQSRLLGKISGRTSDLQWIHSSEIIMPEMDWQDQSQIWQGIQASAIDLSRSIGIRFFVQTLDQNSVVLLQVHHAVSDGLGAVHFLEEILSRYEVESTDSAAVIDPLVENAFNSRGELIKSKMEIKRRFKKDLQRAFLFFRKIPGPIGSLPEHYRISKIFPASVTHEFHSEEVLKLRVAAQAKGATVNDLLLRDFFVGLDLWNQKISPRRRPNLRLAMPMNMRLHMSEYVEAANIVSMCFIDRSPRQIGDPETLLQGIVRETQYLKQNTMGYTMIRFIQILGGLKKGVVMLVTPRLLWKCLATAVISNLGEPWRFSKLPRNEHGQISIEGLTVKGIELLPPIRPLTHAAFGVLTYNGKMSVTMHYDDRIFDEGQSRTLMGIIMDQIRTSGLQA